MAIIAPIHPGEILAEEFLGPFGLTQHRLAVEIGVPPRKISEIVHGKRRITADTALRLARYFGTSEQFWLNLQTRFDLASTWRRVVISSGLCWRPSGHCGAHEVLIIRVMDAW